MDEQDDSSDDVTEKPVIANLMGHELHEVGLGTCLRVAAIAWLATLPWSFLFQTPLPPESVASALLVLLFHEAGVSLSRLSGWAILLGVLIISRPFFAWILGVLVPGTTPVT